MKPDLSVIIVSWNVQQLLNHCLLSLYDSIGDLALWEIYFLRNVCITHYKGQSVKQVGKAIPRFLESFTYVVRKTARDKWDSKLLPHVSRVESLNRASQSGQ